MTISRQHIAALSEFRFRLARFMRFSELASRAAGITPRQYLLLLHVRGQIDRSWASVGELAGRMQASHHGTVALVNRCTERRPGPQAPESHRRQDSGSAPDC